MKNIGRTVLLSISLIFQVSARTCPPQQNLCVQDAENTEGLTCGAKGGVGAIKRKNPKIIHQCTASTLEACRDSCFAASGCESFRWNSEKSICSRYRVQIESLPFEADPHSPSTVYDAACYQTSTLQKGFQLVITESSDGSNIGAYVVSTQFSNPSSSYLSVGSTGAETFTIDSSGYLVSVGDDTFQGSILSMESDGSMPDQLFTFTSDYDTTNDYYIVTCALESDSTVTCQNGQGTVFYTSGGFLGLGPPGSTSFPSNTLLAVCPSASSEIKAADIALKSHKHLPLGVWD